jgi:hypothetical protein
LTSIDLWKCISDKVCDINTPIFQLYTFLFVYKRGFNAYAIYIAKDGVGEVDQKIIDENGIPPGNDGLEFVLLIWIGCAVLSGKNEKF